MEQRTTSKIGIKTTRRSLYLCRNQAGNHATTESGEEDETYVPENNPVIESWVTKSNDRSVNQETNNMRLGQKRPRIEETYSRKRARATVIRATPPRIHADTTSDTGQNVEAVHAEGDHQMAEGAAEGEPVDIFTNKIF
jgi:hypothetical protein